MNNTVNLSIIVQCYNEEKNIPSLLKSFKKILEGKSNIELILVDNGSKDNTGRIIDSEIAKNNYNFIKKITVKENIGYGHGILSGLKEAKGKVLAWTHADLQTDPEDVLKAYNLFIEKPNAEVKIFVKGHRKNRKVSEKVFSFGMEILSSICLGTYLSEINAQPKLFPRDLYSLMENPPHDFSLDLYILYLAKKKGYTLISMPVYFKDRLYSEAKGGGGSDFKTRWKLIKRTFKYIFELRAKIKNERDKCFI